MAEHPEHIEELPGFYQAKRDLFCDLLAPSRFSFTRVTCALIFSWSITR